MTPDEHPFDSALKKEIEQIKKLQIPEEPVTQSDWNAVLAATRSAERDSNQQNESQTIPRQRQNIYRVYFKGFIAAAALIVFSLIFWPPSYDFSLTDSSSVAVQRGFDPLTLPKNLSFSLKSGATTVFVDGDRLSGKLKHDIADSTPMELVYKGELEGKDRNGVNGKLAARMRIVRKTPNAAIITTNDIEQVILEGDFVVGNQASEKVSRGYKP